MLQGSRKRKNSTEQPNGEPLSKRMAEGQILEAIRDVKDSVKAMETQIKAVPTKADLNSIVSQIKEVKEMVIRNTDRIDTLYDLRKEDAQGIIKKVEQMVDGKLLASNPSRISVTPLKISSENEMNFLKSRRTIRIWPVDTDNGIERGVRNFMVSVLKIPNQVVQDLTFERIEKVCQARRSKVHDEILVRFLSSHTRDVIQSYANNLAEAQGKVGLRLDVPDHLRGLFRLFEMHAAALKARHGSLRRSIKFDDVTRSLSMDVKLDDTQWHRISAEEMFRVERNKKNTPVTNTSASSGIAQAEKNRILMTTETTDYPVVNLESEGEERERGDQEQ